MRKTLTSGLAAAAAVLALAVPSAAVASVTHPAVTAQPSGNEFFDGQAGHGVSYVASDGRIQVQIGAHGTTFATWNGDQLKQAGTSNCVTLNSAGYWDMIACAAGKPSQVVSYTSTGGGWEQIVSGYNGDCLRDPTADADVGFGVCVSGGSTYQNFFWD